MSMCLSFKVLETKRLINFGIYRSKKRGAFKGIKAISWGGRRGGRQSEGGGREEREAEREEGEIKGSREGGGSEKMRQRE